MIDGRCSPSGRSSAPLHALAFRPPLRSILSRTAPGIGAVGHVEVDPGQGRTADLSECSGCLRRTIWESESLRAMSNVKVTLAIGIALTLVVGVVVLTRSPPRVVRVNGDAYRPRYAVGDRP